LEQYEGDFVPEADLELWPGKRISYPQIYIWFHEQYKLYSLNTRKKRILSRLRTWAKSQVEAYMGTLEEGARRKAMATAVRHYTALWPNHSALTLYKEILGLGAPRGKRAVELGSPDIPDAVVRESRELFKEGVVAPEDLAPLVYLEERLHGRKETRELDHVVIDEAQDVTPFQLALLRRLTRSDSFTILGDLSQGIHTYTGIASWDEFMAVFPPGAVSYHVLEQSYRSTHEIMTFANQVLIRSGATGPLAKPVFRAGEQVRLRQTDPGQLHEAIAAEVRRLQQQHASVAVVARTDDESKAVHRALLDAGLDAERIVADQGRYKGGLSVIPSYLTKGLEFDGVIVADASADNYGVSPRDARLLYVVCTRALHDLTLLYTGEISPLLDAVPREMYQK
ncbi:MAG: helicase UvrD, partial [Firmicutes bacterium]|nr:helicase UvrD [Bacillota bacterium]